MIDRQGTTFAYRMSEETGATRPTSPGRTPSHARRSTCAASPPKCTPSTTWSSLDTQTSMLLDARKLVERSTRWLLRHRRSPIDIAAEIEFFGPAPGALLDGSPTCSSPLSERPSSGGAPADRAGVSDDLARRVAAFDALYSVFDISEVAARATRPSTGRRRVLPARRPAPAALAARPGERPAPRQPVADAGPGGAPRRPVRAAQGAHRHGAGGGRVRSRTEGRIEAWQASAGPALTRARQVLADVKSSGVFDLATLSVALREVSACASG